jgi:hypothetical protein
LAWAYLSGSAFFNQEYVIGAIYILPLAYMMFAARNFIQNKHKNPSWCLKKRPCKKYALYLEDRDGYPCMVCGEMSKFGAKYK